MDQENILNMSLEQENETERVSRRSRRDNSIDSLSRQSSTDRDIQSQITSLATEVKATIMSLSDTFEGRLDRVNEKLNDVQRHISDLENRNTNNMIGSSATSQVPSSDGTEVQNNLDAHGEASSSAGYADKHSNTKVKPQLYDGLTDIDEYLTQFNIVTEINGWNSQVKALHLASSLTGSARSLLSELDVAHRRDYSHLVRALQNRFGTVNKAEIYRAQLKNRIRQKGEAIPELAQNIKKLTRQAYPDASSDLIDTLALDHFIDSLLDSEMRLRLRECSPKTIQEAETLAVKMEAQRVADRQRSRTIGSVGETSGDSLFSNEVKKITQTVDKLAEKVNKIQNRQGNRDFQLRGGNRHQSRQNYASNRSQGPSRNFNQYNRFRGNNWQRNGGPNNDNRNSFVRQPNHNNSFVRHQDQENSLVRQHEQENESRSSLGTAARPARM